MVACTSLTNTVSGASISLMHHLFLLYTIFLPHLVAHEPFAILTLSTGTAQDKASEMAATLFLSHLRRWLASKIKRDTKMMTFQFSDRQPGENETQLNANNIFILKCNDSPVGLCATWKLNPFRFETVRPCRTTNGWPDRTGPGLACRDAAP